MAWSWRKRTTIIPGVRLNFGKKGISTTIGPRGASMTFGPNGTYLNTSIPGTGLYNRQKIGSKSRNSHMNTDNQGCKGSAMSILSTTLWILVICLALVGFTINAWVGGIYIVLVIAVHVVAEIVAKNKASEAAASLTQDEPAQSSKEYEIQIEKVTKELYADYEKVLKKSNLEELVNSIEITLELNESEVYDITQKVRLAFWIDLTRCYTGLGHLVDMDSKEGLGLLYFIALSKGYNLSHLDALYLKTTYQRAAEDVLKGIIRYIDSAPAIPEIFILSQILKKDDANLYHKFLVDIYRFASITAKADNTITDEEAEWLSNIMKLQENCNQVVLTEDEDKEEDVPLKKFVLPDGTSRLDPMFEDVARYVVTKQEGSIANLQRAFEIGYNRAGKLTDQLEAAGIVGPHKGPKGRDVLIQDMKQLEELLSLINTGFVPANIANITPFTKSAATKKKTTRSSNPTKMLESLIGLGSVKKEVETLSNFIKIQQTREAKGLKTSAVSYHCVFTGNPGTGKTTVARILAKIYKNLGVVTKGHLVETDRAGLVAEYVGQTAVKTNKIVDSALDGVLFIDEAYSLISKSENDYGKEAIATLLKRMEDDRDRLIVILAGYTKEMKDFIDSNPGLQSRFNRYIEFPDYSAEELLQIFEKNMKQYDYHFGGGTRDTLMQYFTSQVSNKDANFGNGRLVRNVFEKTLERQANRLAREVNLTTDKLSQIEIEDLPLK